jgi:hypothetical protein
MKAFVIVLVAVSFICFGWSGSYYYTAQRQANLAGGRIHPLNNHGTIHYLTDRQWHAYIYLDVSAALAFLLGFFLNWFFDPFGDYQRHWEMEPPKRGEQWPRAKRRQRRLPWEV